MFKLSALAELGIRHALTGSRYFGCSTPTSDWDYIVDWPEDDVPWLINALDDVGFSVHSDPCQGDGYHSEFVHTILVNMASGIHLQLCSNFTKKFLMQEILHRVPITSRLRDKSIWKHLWDTAVRAVDCMERFGVLPTPETINPANVFGYERIRTKLPDASSNHWSPLFATANFDLSGTPKPR